MIFKTVSGNKELVTNQIMSQFLTVFLFDFILKQLSSIWDCSEFYLYCKASNQREVFLN
jgi:hypothetical protein